MKRKYVHFFGLGRTGAVMDRTILGNKGAALAEMSSLGMPVPPGFTIGTDVCRYYLEHGTMPHELESELVDAMRWLELTMGRKFNNVDNPLLVSVRSGAIVSMPGMMDTILNVGLTRDSLEGFARSSGERRFALDSYRRLLQMMGTVVFKAPKASFDTVLEHACSGVGTEEEGAFSESILAGIVTHYEQIIQQQTGRPFPGDGDEQLRAAIKAVFDSWNNPRAAFYRQTQGISSATGTAVTVQAMVFGNAGYDSGTGVGFTRNPSTGERTIFGEFMRNAQGEDIVSGTRTPMPLAEFAQQMPSVYTELCQRVSALERHYRNVQDFEFTIEHGKLFLLQTRTAKQSAAAAVRIAVEMVNEGFIAKQEAIARIKAETISEILVSHLDLEGAPEAIATGISASLGAAVGRIALSADEAVRMAKEGSDPIILVSEETTAEDIHGMTAASGLLTSHGGATSHAAVVARGMGKCCITGAKAVRLHSTEREVRIGDTRFREGDWISLDASAGRIYAGRLPVQQRKNDGSLDMLLQWARETARIEVRANSDTPDDARAARERGARGVGLCRTEHMFFAPERLPVVRAMIMAEDEQERKLALRRLLPLQQQDFEQIFRVMAPMPVTIRLLDPPLHEFLPSRDEVIAEIHTARTQGGQETVDALERLERRILDLTETNPMMGHRGCRLSISYPEMLEMQTRAILQAAIAVTQEGKPVQPEIMVPLVGSAEEMSWLRQRIDDTANAVFQEFGTDLSYLVGTMIELPRAALCARAIAEYVSFVSFGTNDLTQMTFGFSRDDAGSFLPSYAERGILNIDPFKTIDRVGVGALIQMAVFQLRDANPHIKIGVCGEHGGDPESIEFFSSLGIDYVSCSPGRVSIAQLAAAQESRTQPVYGTAVWTA